MELLGVVERGLSFILPQSALDQLATRWRSATGESRLTCRFSVGRTQFAQLFDDAEEVRLLEDALVLDDEEVRTALLAEGLHEIAVRRAEREGTTVHEALGLAHPQFSPHLSLPAWSRVNPWSQATPEERLRSFPRAVVKNRAQHGMRLTESAARQLLESPAWSSAESHAQQYAKLISSIHRKGPLLTLEPLPTVLLLTDGGNVRWVMGAQGNHRARICAALGMTSFTGRVSGLVDVRELNHWPGITRGVMHPDDAEMIFFRYFYAHGLKD